MKLVITLGATALLVVGTAWAYQKWVSPTFG